MDSHHPISVAGAGATTNFKSINRKPRQTSSSVTRSEHDAGQPPGDGRTSIAAFGDASLGTAAALGFRDLLPTLPTSPKISHGALSPVEQASRTLTRPPLHHRSETTFSSAHQNMPYSSWSSAPSVLKPDARHGASRVYTFMPSTGRVPVPPPLRSHPSSPTEELPPPLSKDMHRRFSSASSVTTSPSGETYWTFSSDSGNTYFSSRSNRGPASTRRESADDSTTESGQTSPPPATPYGTKDMAPFGPHDGAMSAYEPRALAESDLTNASIGRTVDEALTALLGATKLVQAGLGSAALVIGPVEGRSPLRHAVKGPDDDERDPTRRPSPPPSMAARGEGFKPPSGLITLNPGALPERKASQLINSTINAQPRAIRATVVPPMRVSRPQPPT